MSKKPRVDEALLPSWEALGKRNPGRRSTRQSYVSASQDPVPSATENYWKWEGMRRGVLLDKEGDLVDEEGNKVSPNESDWTRLLPETRVMIMDMAARSLHRDRMVEVVKEIGKTTIFLF